MYIINKAQKNKKSSFNITTPTGNLSARGTSGFVAVSDTQTLVANQSGSMVTTSSDPNIQGTQTLGAMMKNTIPMGKAPTPATSLSTQERNIFTAMISGTPLPKFDVQKSKPPKKENKKKKKKKKKSADSDDASDSQGDKKSTDAGKADDSQDSDSEGDSGDTSGGDDAGDNSEGGDTGDSESADAETGSDPAGGGDALEGGDTVGEVSDPAGGGSESVDSGGDSFGGDTIDPSVMEVFTEGGFDADVDLGDIGGTNNPFSVADIGNSCSP